VGATFQSFVGALAKFRKTTVGLVILVCPSICLSLRPHGTTRFLFYGFPQNFIFRDFSKICQANSSSIKIWQE